MDMKIISESSIFKAFIDDNKFEEERLKKNEVNQNMVA